LKNLNLSIYESISNNYTIKYSEYGRTGNRSWCICDDKNEIKYIIKFRIVIEKEKTWSSQLSLKIHAPHKHSEAELNLPNSELNEFLNLLLFNPKLVKDIDYNKIYELYSRDTFTPKDDISILQEIKDTPQAVLVHKIVILKLEESTPYTTEFQMSLTPNTKLTALELHDRSIMLSKVKYLKYGDAYKKVKSKLNATLALDEAFRLAIENSIAIIKSSNTELVKQKNKFLIKLEDQGDIVWRLVLQANPYVNTDPKYTGYNEYYMGIIINYYIRTYCTIEELTRLDNNFLYSIIKILSNIIYNSRNFDISLSPNPRLKTTTNEQIWRTNNYIKHKIVKTTGYQYNNARPGQGYTLPDYLVDGVDVEENKVKTQVKANLTLIINYMNRKQTYTDIEKDYFAMLAIIENKLVTLVKTKRSLLGYGGNNNKIVSRTPRYKLGGGNELEKGDVRVLAEFIYKNTLEKRSDFKAATTEGGKNKTLNINRINRRNKSNKKTTTNIKNKTKKSKNKTINFKRINRKNKTM
jgi:hypothetical protein